MSGNTANAAVWGGADVLVGATTAIIPDGNDPFPIRRDVSVTTVNTDATITFASGAITAYDVGQSISGAGIPLGATILSWTDATHAELSANATASATVTAEVGLTTGWRFGGLLDGDQGFEEGITVQETEHSAWGYGVIAITYKGKKTTRTFTALEENSVVMGLVYDTEDMTFDDEAGTYEGDLGVRDDTERVMLAFIVTSGDIEKRAIVKNYATIAATQAGKESETALASKNFTATIFPTNDKKLWTVYKGASA